ncbi:MAG: EamA family transporter [Lentisphaeria bacterium]
MLYLLIVSLIWSFSFVIIKGALTSLDANLVAFLRLLLALLVFLPLLRLKKLKWGLFWRLLGIGAIQFGVMYSAYTAAFSYLPAYMLVLLTATTPLYVVFFDLLLARRNTPLFWLAALASVFAAWLLQYQGNPLEFNWKGVFLLQLSNVAFAAGQIYYRKLALSTAQWDNRGFFSIVYLGGVLLTLTACFFSCSWSDVSKITLQQWVLLGYLGIVASGLCFFLWNVGGTRVSAGSYALLNNLKIPLGVLISLWFLGEQCNYVLLGITLLIFMISVYLCETITRQSQAKET